MAFSIDQRIDYLERNIDVDHDISNAKTAMKSLGSIPLDQEQIDRIANIIVRSFSGGLTDYRNGAYRYGSTPKEERETILSIAVQCDNPKIITKIIEICTVECTDKLAVGESWFSWKTFVWVTTVFSGSASKIIQRLTFAQELALKYDPENRLGFARLGVSPDLSPEEMSNLEEEIPEILSGSSSFTIPTLDPDEIIPEVDEEGNIITPTQTTTTTTVPETIQIENYKFVDNEENSITLTQTTTTTTPPETIQIGDFSVIKVNDQSYEWTDKENTLYQFIEKPTVAQLNILNKPMQGKTVKVMSF